MQILAVSCVNTAFWPALHFGTAFFFTSLPDKVQARIFTPSLLLYREKPREAAFYRAIGLPRWKDSLPQYNKDFDKRCLNSKLTLEYLNAFIVNTCKAELIHLSIAVLGFLSLFSCFFFDHPAKELPLFIAVAAVIGFAQLPFIMIQRYNRPRLKRLAKRLEQP